MSRQQSETGVEILGKIYQIKCPDEEVPALQRAAALLEEKMRDLRDGGGVFNLDRLAIITALNIAHQLFNMEHQKENHLQKINDRIHALQNRVEQALMPTEQLDLQPIE